MTLAVVHRILPGAPLHARSRLLALATEARDGDIATFGEPARQTLGAAVDRIRAEMRGGELTECLAVLAHLRSGLETLTPASLVARRGLAGLFDSRRRRLRAFRARFGEITRTLSESLDDLQVRRGAVNRRSEFADRLWSDLRADILEIDAHALAAAAASGSDADGLQARRAKTLADVRDAAIRVLPQVRRAQNADAEAARRIRATCDALMEWHAEWRSALGLDGQDRRRKAQPPSERLRPDQARLIASRDTVLAMIDATTRQIDAARRRRLEADGRIEAARAAV